LANSVSQALSSEGSEALADSEIHSLIENHVRDMMSEGAYGYQSQKTNLEEQNYLNIMQEVSNKLDSNGVGIIMTTLSIYVF